VTASRDEHVVVGAIWRSKRESWRTVKITGTGRVAGRDDGGYVFVRRNTSNRRQAIKLTTLVRDYRFERMAGAL
jgi:hypothetical protein